MRERTVVFVFATLLALPLRTLGQSSFQYDANGNLTNVTSAVASGPPTITAPPTNQDVIIGEDAGFSVAVTGSGPIGYQWFLNGVAVQGATNSTIFIPNSSVSNQGSYSVVVSNPSGSVTSTVPALLIFDWQWIAPDPAQWNDPSSWDPAIVPTGFYNINLTAGTVLLNTPVTMTGDLTWSGGTIGAGLLTIAPGATLTVAGVNGNVYDVQGVWTNAGTIDLVSGDFRLNSGNTASQGQLINLPGALLDITTNVSVYNAYGNELLVNAGTVEKTGGTGSSMIYPVFNNSGLVDALTGTINIAGTGSGNGAFEAGAGATLDFANNYTANGGAQFLGNGINQLTVGTLTLNGNINGSSLFLTGGICVLNGTVSNLTLAGAGLGGNSGVVAGVLTWTSGILVANGSTLTIATNGVVVLAGVNGNNYDVQGILTNAGAIELASGNLRLDSVGVSGQGQLINLPGAMLDITVDNSVFNAYGNELLVNQGTVEKTGGTGTSTILPIFNNTGLVEALTGTINIAGGGSGNGVFEAGAGTTLTLSDGYTGTNGMQIIGAGTNVFTGGTFTLGGSAIITSLQLAGGTLTVNGPTTISNLVLTGGTLALNEATVSNVTLAGATLGGSDGVIEGVLTWNGGVLTASGSTLTVATNGVVILAGVNGNDYDVQGVLTNAGTIELASGNLRLNSVQSSGQAELINLPGAVVDITADVSIYNVFGNELLLNVGTVEKTGGTGTSTIGTTYNNGGLVEGLTGTINIAVAGSGNGVFETGAGATLSFSDGYTANAGAQFTGAGTITFPSGLTINPGVDFTGTGTNLLTGGTVAWNGLVTVSNLTLAGATLTGNNGIVAGALTWTSGILVASKSTLTIATNGVVTLAGVNGNVYDVQGDLTNAGTIELVSGNLRLNSAQSSGQGELINLPGALVNLTGDVSVFNVYGNELLVNEGTVEKTGGTGTSTIYSVLNNTGLVESLTGTINIASAGSGNGVFETGPGATLSFSGGYAANGGAQFTGAGTITFPNGLTVNPGVNFAGIGTNLLTGGTVTWNGVVTVSNLTLAGATLTGNNGVVAGALTWTSGILVANGSTLTIATNGVVILAGINGNVYDVQGVLTNAGTIELASGNLRLNSGNSSGQGELINLPGALLEMTADVSIGNAYGDELLVNEGTLEKTGGTGTSSIYPIFDNTGTLNAQSGTISLTGEYAFAGGTLDIGISGATSFGVIHFAGNALLIGLGLNVNLEKGFLPAAGESFEVVTYNSEFGIFSTPNFPPIGTWQTNYGSSAFTLTALSVRPNLIPSLFTNGEPNQLPQLLLQFTGNTNVSYTVLASTNLALPFSNWTDLGAPLLLSSNLYLFIDSYSPNIPARFYIVRSP